MRKVEERHVRAVAELGCIACYVQFGVEGTPCEIHHTRHKVGMAQRAGWFDVIGLCPEHHRNSGNGKKAIHAGIKTFEALYGTEEELLQLTYDLIGVEYE